MKLGFSAFFGLRDSRVEGWGFAASVMRADPDKKVEPHVHDGAHLIAILSGTYRSLADPGRPLGPADIVYNPHDTEHEDTFDGDGRFLALSYDPEKFPLEKHAPQRPRCLDAALTLASVVRICALLERSGEPDRQELEAFAIALADKGAAAEREHCSGPPPNWARAARARLEAGGSGVSVAQLAFEQGMHPVAFTRAFRRYFGRAPLAFALDARLSNAAQDLAKGRRQLADIGLRWGFYDQAHFARHFRKRFGASPAAFRRIFQS